MQSFGLSLLDAKSTCLVLGHDFTGCGKTHSGGRPGIYPRYKDNEISGGFSH